MGGLKTLIKGPKTPKAPPIPEPVEIPDPDDDSIRRASRRRAAMLSSASGVASTIRQSAGGSLGQTALSAAASRDYSGQTLG